MKGQITITGLVGWGVTIAVAFGGLMWGAIMDSNSKVHKVEESQSVSVQRVATLEEAVRTIKEDNMEIKKDVKEILRRLR